MAALAGVLAAGSGLAVSELLSGLFGQRLSPLSAVAEGVVALTPGAVVEAVISAVGNHDKQLLLAVTLLVVAIVSAAAGWLALRSVRLAQLAFALMGVVVLIAVYAKVMSSAKYVSAVAGTLTAIAVVTLLVRRLDAARSVEQAGASAADHGTLRTRREFLTLSGAVAVGAVVAGFGGRALSQGRRAVDAARRSIGLPVTQPTKPAGVSVGVKGVAPWVTSPSKFYRVDTAFSVPQLVPDDWELRVHGMVDREVRLGFQDLIDLGVSERWMTLCCVSNPVGGGLVGNAWWSGVLTSKVLAEAGVSADADAVLSRSQDGWTCGTPLRALTDNRASMFAIAMNGEPLLPQHGFPVRMIVPGLYGYVSATKWVVDVTVTRFDDFQAFWTERGWAERGPVKTQSRIDVPESGADVPAGKAAVAGVAWAQHRGISKVEVRVDDGPWRRARLADAKNIDCWRQWVYTWDATPGDHELAVRATDGTGTTQIGKPSSVLPDGATGWDTVSVHVS